MNRVGAIRAISQNLGDLTIDSIVASLTATSIYAADFVFTNEKQLFGKYLYIDTGAGAGQSRVVGSLHPANKFIVFAQSFNSIPSVNSSFVITDYFRKADYDNALDRAIGIARLKYLEDRVATIQLVATQYEYAVPSGFDYITCIRLVPSSHTDYAADSEVDTIFEIPPRDFRVERNPVGSYVIIFDPRRLDMDDYNNELAHVIGQAKPVVAGSDNGTLPADLEEYLIAMSSMLLSSRRMAENQEWVRKFYMFRDEVKGRGNEAGLEEYIFRHGRGKRVA